MLLAALVGQLLLLVTTFTWLQEVSFRWIGLTGVALPTSLALAIVGTVAGVLAIALGPVRRRRTLLVTAGMLAAWSTVVVLGAPTLHGIVSPSPAGDGAPLSLVTQNLWYENDDPDATARAVMGRDADVMVLVEYTPAHARAFREAGVRSAYPYRWEEPGELGGGLAVMSKVPFDDVERLSTWSGAVRMELDTGGGPVVLYAVHPVAPSDYWGLRRWKGDYRTLIDAIDGAGPSTVVAGDFNATGAHRRFRELKAVGGLRDAQDISGAGFGATWPSNDRWPPIMRLDHVLVGAGIGVAQVEVLDDVGADHRGVEARLRIPAP
jgi:endonuclease/exonuclease/phosphatase (EEP) superfamily protein YafD